MPEPKYVLDEAKTEHVVFLTEMFKLKLVGWLHLSVTRAPESAVYFQPWR